MSTRSLLTALVLVMAAPLSNTQPLPLTQCGNAYYPACQAAISPAGQTFYYYCDITARLQHTYTYPDTCTSTGTPSPQYSTTIQPSSTVAQSCGQARYQPCTATIDGDGQSFYYYCDAGILMNTYALPSECQNTTMTNTTASATHMPNTTALPITTAPYTTTAGRPTVPPSTLPPTTRPPLIVLQTPPPPTPLPACSAHGTSSHQTSSAVQYQQLHPSGYTPAAEKLYVYGGDVYGTAMNVDVNGTAAGGGLFRITPDGSNFTYYNLASDLQLRFIIPVGGVTESTGLLIGAASTTDHGYSNAGLFAVNISSHNVTSLSIFPSSMSVELYSQVITSRSGLIVGTAYFSTLGSIGLYTVDPTRPTDTLQVYLFNGTNVKALQRSVVEDMHNDGVFYGTSREGCDTNGLPGTYGYGCLYMVNTSQPVTNAVSVLHTFHAGTSSAWYPDCALVYGPDNITLFGTSSDGDNSPSYGFMFTYNTMTQQYADVFPYDVQSDVGDRPFVGVVLAADGRMYGTTARGGANNQGSIYSFDPRDVSGTMTMVHANSQSDYFGSGLVDDGAGRLFGIGAGSVFSLQYHCKA